MRQRCINSWGSVNYNLDKNAFSLCPPPFKTDPTLRPSFIFHVFVLNHRMHSSALVCTAEIEVLPLHYISMYNLLSLTYQLLLLALAALFQ